MRKSIETDQAPSPIGPYSQAVKINNLLFISGQIPIDPNSGDIICASIEEETNQVMKNLQGILTADNLTFENVVKTSIFIRNMDDFPKINEIYGKYFSENLPPPARETVEVSRLPKNVNVEISAIASH